MEGLPGKSFVAQVACVSPGYCGPIAYSTHPQIAKSGWLLRSHRDAMPVPLRFDFLEALGERLHYKISGAQGAGDYEKAVLGISTNGYAGFYQVANVAGFWKVQVTGEGSLENNFRFLLRDHHGQRLAINTEEEVFGNLANPHPGNTRRFDYLSVWHGEVVEFEARILHVL